MTKKEMAKLLGYGEEFFHVFFRTAAKQDNLISNNIKAKNNTSTRNKVVDYTLEECLYMLNFCPTVTKIQRQILIDCYIERKGNYLYQKEVKVTKSASAHCFLNLLKIAHSKIKVCSTCVYLIARRPNKAGCKPSPFCNLYGFFINKVKPRPDIYRDRCSAYEWSDRPPLVFNSLGVEQVDIKKTDKPVGGVVDGVTIIDVFAKQIKD